MKTSEAIDQLATALALAQGEMEVAKKDNTNTYLSKGETKAKYADITNVWIACRAALSKHGLCVVQSPSVTPEKRVKLTTRLIHKSGQWIEDELDLRPKEDTSQAIGSCITYARRYALGSMVGVVAEDEDDDGNSASISNAKLHNQKDTTNSDQPKQQAKQNIVDSPKPDLGDALYQADQGKHKLAMFEIVRQQGVEDAELMKTLSQRAMDTKVKVKDLFDFVYEQLNGAKLEETQE